MSFIDRVFGRGGFLAAKFPGYEPREGQVKLAGAVLGAVQAGQNLLAEAPTGTGKSLAYGVPAVWWASPDNPERTAGKLPQLRAVIVTANIALQEQLVAKDLPLMREILPLPFTFSLMKGRSNYLCLEKWEESTAELALAPLTDETDRRQWKEIDAWALKTETGDLSDLPFEPSPRVRRLVVIGQDDCLGSKCAKKDECFAERQRRAAKEADIIVTNYHLFFTDLVIRMQTAGEAGLLPEHGVVIFDEGHKAADIARDFFGFKITRGGIRHATRLLSAPGTAKKQAVEVDAELKKQIADLADDFARDLARYAQSEDYEKRLREKDPVEWKPLHDALVRAGGLLSATSNQPGWEPGRKREIQLAADKCGTIAAAIQEAMLLESQEEGRVYFLELDQEKRNAVLVCKPLEIADTLRQNLFESGRVRSTIVTSATLTSQGSFDFVATELGCETAQEVEAPSPFNWRDQAVLVVPSQISWPTESRYSEDVGRIYPRLVEAADGRTLGLFTSYRMLDIVHKKLLAAGWGDRLMRQGDAPRTQLIRRFKEEVGSVLLGTESFWAGVDVPGEALSLVIIDRLPFPSPEDPMLDAYEEKHGSRTFKDYSIPRAVIQFRQGVGRLIRSTHDTGVIVCLDRRLADKPYGRMFTKSLPQMRQSRDLAEVARFFGG